MAPRPHGSGSRLFSCWCGSRCHPPRRHGQGQLLELDLNDETPMLQAAQWLQQKLDFWIEGCCNRERSE